MIDKPGSQTIITSKVGGITQRLLVTRNFKTPERRQLLLA